MPKLKPGAEFDPDELDVEYEKSTYTTYDGEIPRTGTILYGRITKMWWTETSDGEHAMIKALFVAEGNEGDLEEYDGLPVWENLAFVTSAAWKYGPFLELFDFTLHDIKNKMIVADNDDNIGAPIEKIGSFVPGSDDALCRVITKKDRWNGEWQAKAQEFLSWDDEEEEEEEKPAPKAARRAPARGKAAAKPAPRGTRSKQAEPEPDEDDEDEDEEEEEEAKPARRARGSRATARATANGRAPRGRAKATAGARRGRKAADDEDEPPF